MPMREVTIEKGKDWQLAVAKEFGDIVGEHPDFIPTVYQIVTKDMLAPDEHVIERNGVKVTRVFHSGQHSDLYRVDFGEHSFALKLADREVGGTDAFAEAESTRAAEELFATDKQLKNLKLKVIPFQLGYSDQHYSFFVSKWKEDRWVNLQEYMMDRMTSRDPKDKKLINRAFKVAEILEKKKFVDAGMQNCLYDPESDEIIVFDVQKKK